MRLFKKMRKYDWSVVIKSIPYVAMMLLVIWIIASWINVICHNTTDYNYWTYNFFTLF